MGFSIKQLGNFPQFWKEELSNLLYVAWIAFYGACMIILIQFKKTPEKLDAMLPTKLPTIDHPYAKPYAVKSSDKEQMGMLTYLFSYDSDFPYNLKTDIETIDGYLFFFGGMGSYLYASHRSALKSIIEFLDVDNYFVDVFCFYILPTVLFYIVLIPIIPIVSFCCINFISCFYQPRLHNAYFFAFACIFNVFNYDAIKANMDLSQFPQNIISYIISVMMGCLMSFILVPGVSAMYSIAVWLYVIGFVKLMPLVIIFLGGLSWKELGSKLLEQLGRHYIGLTVLFLYWSIAIANKNLDQKVAWGTHAGIIILILMSLNIFDFLKNIYHYYNGDITSFPNPMCALQKQYEPNPSPFPTMSMKCS
jgi:hypothetical protein